MIALHQDVANCQNTLTVLTQSWRILRRYMNESDVYDRCGHDTTSSLNDKKCQVTDVSVVKDDKEGRKEGNVSFNDVLNTF